MDSSEKKEIHVDDLFEQYLREDSCLSILSTFKELCDILGLSNETNKRVLYDRFTSTITSRRAQCVWELLNKRRSLEVYQNGTACEDMKVIIRINTRQRKPNGCKSRIDYSKVQTTLDTTQNEEKQTKQTMHRTKTNAQTTRTHSHTHTHTIMMSNTDSTKTPGRGEHKCRRIKYCSLSCII